MAENTLAQIFASDFSTTSTNASPFLKNKSIHPWVLVFAVLLTWVCREFIKTKGQQIFIPSTTLSPSPRIIFQSPTLTAGGIPVAVREPMAHGPCSYRRQPLFPILLWRTQQWSLSSIESKHPSPNPSYWKACCFSMVECLSHTHVFSQ